jgi:hypothetical protein
MHGVLRIITKIELAATVRVSNTTLTRICKMTNAMFKSALLACSSGSIPRLSLVWHRAPEQTPAIYLHCCRPAIKP